MMSDTLVAVERQRKLQELEQAVAVAIAACNEDRVEVYDVAIGYACKLACELVR